MKSLSSASILGAQNAALLVILIMAIVMANSSLGLRPHQFSFQDQEGDLGNNGDHTSPTNPKQGYIIRSGNKSNNNKNKALGMEMYPTGSSLPDCSHACGPCFPCKRVMVSFKCSVESCPIVYRCMCKGKYYHVPSN